MSSKDEKRDDGPENPPSYEESMRQYPPAPRETNPDRGYNHTPRVNSKRGFPGGEKLSYGGKSA